MNNIIKRTWNQNRMVNIEDLRGMAFQAEDGGHTFEISGINDAEEAVELSGTVAGVCMRPDGTDVALTGDASDGVVSVTLSDACYAVAGRFGLYIFVTSDSKKTCVYACIGTIAQSSYGTVAGDTPQSVVDLINAINTLGIEKITESLVDSNGWTTGYIGQSTISNTTTNGDIRTTKAARVHKGDTVKIKIALPLNGSNGAYFYHVFVRGENDFTYVSARSGGYSATQTSDENYQYFSKEIAVTSDGWIMFSYRPQSLSPSVSVFSHVYTTDRLNALENRMNDAEDSIDSLEASNEADYYYRFPSGDSFPISSCHRGLATSGLPENTLTAFRDAKSKGWKWVETDIRLTSDGVWVCLHDASINRTARNSDGTAISGTVNIADITYAQALTYDFGIYAGSQYAGTKILTLDDFINYCQKAHLYAQIEVKSSAWSEAQMLTAWQLVEKYSMQNRVMFLCSSVGGLDDLVGFHPYLPVAFTGMPNSWTVIDPADFGNTVPAGYSLKTGKNKLFLEPSQARFTTLAAMENFIDYAHYWGCYTGVYGPVTESEINALSDRLDLVCSQYFKYDEVKEEEI